MKKGISLLILVISLVTLLGCGDRIRRTGYTVDGIVVGGYPVVFKEIPKLNYLHQSATLNKKDVKSATKQVAMGMMQQVERLPDVNIIGPLTYVIDDLMNNSHEIVTMNIGFPVDAMPDDAKGQFKTLDSFKCLTVRIPVDDEYTKTMWYRLHQVAYKEGYHPTGEGRTVITFNDTGSNYVMELQLGIRKPPSS